MEIGKINNFFYFIFFFCSESNVKKIKNLYKIQGKPHWKELILFEKCFLSLKIDRSPPKRKISRDKNEKNVFKKDDGIIQKERVSPKETEQHSEKRKNAKK